MGDFQATRIVTARIEHCCEECGDNIRPGAQYRWESGRWEGAMYAQKLCLACGALMDWCWANDVFDADGRELGQMLYDLTEADLIAQDHDVETVDVTEKGARWLEIDPVRNYPRLALSRPKEPHDPA